MGHNFFVLEYEYIGNGEGEDCRLWIVDSLVAEVGAMDWLGCGLAG